MKLTPSQRLALKQVAAAHEEDPLRGLRRSSTNPSLCALENRGLVELDFVESQHVSGIRVERWLLTAAGRAALT